ncbi:gliding motility-associated C-terminal domain-containing protein [Flavobacteriaceae bacterium XHP0103]|uniref:gliding motility-associated C-terminal domain-containing protein n=1 Tax=Marixanthotalea marina TaxID=2844359 RepID=UPI002989AC85|nr:gliding motility-associated C-terminal domain-containing protein [Marixanthotalea marina]MBU3820907.1 gliding motility-associated C-terminal domain-containing protein [Marixanthotalea marina]
MKTNYVFRYAKLFAVYIMVFLWGTNMANAQCPTVNDPNPIICDASGYTFSNLSADYATDNGGGIVWYDQSSGGTAFNPSQLVNEGTYYADDSSGSCGTRNSITVTFTVPVSGQNLDAIFCSNENPTIQSYINEALQSSIPSGGSVKVYNDFALTDEAIPADAIPNGGKTYYIVFVDSGTCESQIEIGQTAIFMSPADPTPNSTQMFCSDATPTVADLNPGTTALSYSWYASVDAFGDPIQPPLSASTLLVDGNTYYVQIDDVFCDSNAIPVTVTISSPYDPGTNAPLEYCDDNIPASDFDLFDELGGTPDNVGSWSGPLTTSNGYQGTVNISTLTTPGTYTFTYTVPANGACPESSASISITIHETFTSGNPSTLNPASYCESGAPASFDLFTLIENYDTGGQWTQGTTSSDPVVASPSALDLSGFTPGTYNFTYTQNLTTPCTEESTTVQVEILTDPNAGMAVNQTFCENDLATNSPFNLFDALDGSQDNNSGTWTDASDNTISNTLDLTTLTVTGSPYTFNYTIDNGTCSDTEAITITVQPAPESGTPVATFPEYCEGSAPASYDLFDLLEGEDQTGTWYVGTDNTGSTITTPVDLSAYTAGTYDFTFDVNAIGSCDDVLVTVSVTINPLPNTGIPTPAVFCENDLVSNSPLDLFGQLSGEDAGGTWTDDDATGALSGSNVDLTLLTIGSYSFTYTITDPNSCTNSSTVIVSVQDAPESGTANAPVEFCMSDITAGQTYDLYDLLTGEDQTGTWSDDDATGALTGNTLTLDGLAQGTYNFTYDVAAIGSCDDVNVTVSVVINDTPAPTAATPQEFCDTATVGELIATGNNIQWYADATGGAPLASTDALVDGEDYFSTQTDATSGCESSVRTQVIATIYQSPNAGNPATPIVACNTNTNIDLNSGLDGTQDTGGIWQDTDSTGAVSGNTFDASAVAPGNYQFTYYVAANAPCTDDATTITVTVEAPLSTGTSTTLDICSDGGTTDLFILLGSADIGGTWSPALASGTGIFDPLIDTSGTYTYTLNNACGTVSSDVVVTVTQAANAGSDNDVTVCVIDGITDLFPSLGTSAQTGGTWSPALASGTGEFDPLVDTAGVYTYTVTAVSPCTADASAQITVAISDSPAPVVLDANPEFCRADNPTVSDLNASIRATGTISWYADATLASPLSLTEALVDGIDYYARQTTTTGCESSESVMITATVNDVATPTLVNSNLELCINDDPTILELTENIVEYDSSLDNVIWYDAATGGNSFNSTDILVYGVTYYASLYDASTGCESSVRLSYTPDLTSCGELVLPDGFSPNGDGVNDTYDYNNLNILYPNFNIEIFNRYGTVVYKGNANTPRFDGSSNQSSLGKKQLPVGVYFYIFNFNDGENKPKQGRLYLSR